MDQYNNPLTQSLMQMHRQLYSWFKDNPEEWRDKIEDDFKTVSNGKFRVFQTFFDSPQEVLSGIFRQQVLSEEDIKRMYPKFYDTMKDIPQNKYCYMFACNNGLGEGQALIAQSIITFDK